MIEKLAFFHLTAVLVSAQTCENQNFGDYGKYLEGSVFYSFSTPGIMACGYECVITARCLSSNYNLTSRVCELNEASKTTIPGSFVSRSEVIYSDKSVWPLSLAGPCRHALCPLGTKCSPTINNDYICANSDCNAPPPVSNASPVTNDRRIGALVRYACEPGYLLADGPAEVTCGEDSTWSSPNFLCFRATSCVDYKTCNSAYSDGEYWMLPPILGDSKIKIYCHDMATSYPTEYVTLHVPSVSHYDTYEAADYWESTCNVVWVSGSTTSTFNKIRVDLMDMHVIRDDFTFASVTRDGGSGSPQMFGDAGDCTYAHGCTPRRGHFNINMIGTGLVVNRTLEWIGTGWGPKMHDMVYDTGGAIRSGKCGGKCGGCTPGDPCRLELNTQDTVDDPPAATLPCT